MELSDDMMMFIGEEIDDLLTAVLFGEMTMEDGRRVPWGLRLAAGGVKLALRGKLPKPLAKAFEAKILPHIEVTHVAESEDSTWKELSLLWK